MPSLDTPTLLLVSCAVTFLVGAQFLLSWRQAPERRSLALWGWAHLSGATASGGLALRGAIPDMLSVGAANAVMLAAYGLLWSGLRHFEGRPPRIASAFLGAAAWCGLCLMPAFYGSLPVRVAFASLAAGAYCAAGARELWRGRAERLASRRPAIVLLGAYAACYFVRVPAAALFPLPAGQSPLASNWVPVLCLAAMLFSIASAFTFIGLVKERAEREQRVAARTDPLTGIANRRAFVEAASQSLAQRGDACLLLFDLDRFKAVNDTFGHAVGDAALVAFCAVAEAALPERAVLGRLGGEEFGCLLPGLTGPAARRVAEEVRGTFARIALPELPDLRLSVSVGLARTDERCAFEGLLRRADAALYAAKELGRDRVEADDHALRAA